MAKNPSSSLLVNEYTAFGSPAPVTETITPTGINGGASKYNAVPGVSQSDIAQGFDREHPTSNPKMSLSLPQSTPYKPNTSVIMTMTLMYKTTPVDNINVYDLTLLVDGTVTPFTYVTPWNNNIAQIKFTAPVQGGVHPVAMTSAQPIDMSTANTILNVYSTPTTDAVLDAAVIPINVESTIDPLAISITPTNTWTLESISKFDSITPDVVTEPSSTFNWSTKTTVTRVTARNQVDWSAVANFAANPTLKSVSTGIQMTPVTDNKQVFSVPVPAPPSLTTVKPAWYSFDIKATRDTGFSDVALELGVSDTSGLLWSIDIPISLNNTGNTLNIQVPLPMWFDNFVLFNGLNEEIGWANNLSVSLTWSHLSSVQPPAILTDLTVKVADPSAQQLVLFSTNNAPMPTIYPIVWVDGVTYLVEFTPAGTQPLVVSLTAIQDNFPMQFSSGLGQIGSYNFSYSMTPSIDTDLLLTAQPSQSNPIGWTPNLVQSGNWLPNEHFTANISMLDPTGSPISQFNSYHSITASLMTVTPFQGSTATAKFSSPSVSVTSDSTIQVTGQLPGHCSLPSLVVEIDGQSETVFALPAVGAPSLLVSSKPSVVATSYSDPSILSPIKINTYLLPTTTAAASSTFVPEYVYPVSSIVEAADPASALFGSGDPQRHRFDAATLSQMGLVRATLEPSVTLNNDGSATVTFSAINANLIPLTKNAPTLLTIWSAAPLLELSNTSVLQSFSSVYDPVVELWASSIPVDISNISGPISSTDSFEIVSVSATPLDVSTKNSIVTISQTLSNGAMTGTVTLTDPNYPKAGQLGIVCVDPTDPANLPVLDISSNPSCAFFFEPSIETGIGSISTPATLRTALWTKPGPPQWMSFPPSWSVYPVQFDGQMWNLPSTNGIPEPVVAGQMLTNSAPVGTSLHQSTVANHVNAYLPLVINELGKTLTALPEVVATGAAATGYTPYGPQKLSLAPSSPFNWWLGNSADLATWSSQWSIQTLIQFPQARLHFTHTSVSTTQGPKWVHNNTSEGISISFDRLSIVFGASEELVLKDPTSNANLPPTYVRSVTVSSGTISKTTYVSSKTDSGETNPWALIEINHTPSPQSYVTILVNGRIALTCPLDNSLPSGKLVLGSLNIVPVPVSDPVGEITLTQPWPDDGSTEPTYTINQHQTQGYPSSYTGFSPLLGFIEVSTTPQTHPNLSLPVSTGYKPGPAKTIFSRPLSTQPLPSLTVVSGAPTQIKVTTLNPDGSTANEHGLCTLWWDTTNFGSIQLGTCQLNAGTATLSISPIPKDSGFLRLENLTLGNGLGYSYLPDDPLPLKVV